MTASQRARLDRRGAWAGGMGSLGGWAAIFLLGNPFSNELLVLLVTFFLALPVVNGLWDWGSWLVSRWLGRDLLARLEGGSAGRRAWTITWHALADLALALLFLLSLGWFLAFTFEAYNRLALRHDGLPAYDLGTFISAAAAEPWGDGFWLSAMLVSTLIPTLLHGLILLASPLVLLVEASPKRAEMAAALAGYEAADAANRPAILQNVAWYLARSQWLAWAGAALMLLTLLAGFSALVTCSPAAAWPAGSPPWPFGASKPPAGCSDRHCPRPAVAPA